MTIHGPDAFHLPAVPFGDARDSGPRAAGVTARDVLGGTRLALDAVKGLAHVVESMHLTISRSPLPLAPAVEGRTQGITGGVYASIRLAIAGLDEIVGLADTSLARWVPAEPLHGSAAWLAWRSALNGVVGDHLAATGNPLALRMTVQRGDGEIHSPLDTPRLLLLVHGLCMNDLQWRHAGYSHADRLQRELGVTVLHLRYNSGLHISDNGAELSRQLERLLGMRVTRPRLDVLAHSMGGLVVRSALHQAALLGHQWPQRLSHLVFLGSPHHGAPLERGGQRLQAIAARTAYTAPLSRLGRLRSAGVTDLRHACLLEQDWHGVDRFSQAVCPRGPVPLPPGLAAYAVAASLGAARGDRRDRLWGDGLVPVASALGEGPHPAHRLDFPRERQALFLHTDHWALLRRPEIGERISRWLREDG